MNKFTSDIGGERLEPEKVLAESPEEVGDDVESIQKNTAKFLGKVWVEGKDVFDTVLQFRMARILAYRKDYGDDDMIVTAEFETELCEDATEIHAQIKGLKKGLRRLGMKLNFIKTSESRHSLDDMFEDEEGMDESGVFWLERRNKQSS